ncbi:MAG: polysaccharide deacetylase family protein [Candidatus Paceibacterota bacterium]
MLENRKKVALSFDVELWNESEWLKPHIKEEILLSDRSFEKSIDNILNLLKKNSHTATFFITKEVIEKFPEYISKISKEGHEVGVHGPKHIRLEKYDPETFTKDCKNIIEKIEKITGQKPKGYRAPHFSLNQKTSWLIPTLVNLGFVYDSSVFPINLNEYGISNCPAKPYKISNENITKENPDSNLTEVPISIASFGKIKIPFAGGIYFRILPLFIFKWLLKISSKNSTPVIYFHPHELEHSTPQIKSGPFVKRLLKYWGTKSSFQKLEKISNSYSFVSIFNIF